MLPGPPRPNRLKSDGRSPGLRVQAIPILPGLKASGSLGALTAHSCGGSRGFGGWWLHLTAFPFHPQRFVDTDETVALLDIKPALLGKGRRLPVNLFSRKPRPADLRLANPRIKFPLFAGHHQMRTSASLALKDAGMQAPSRPIQIQTSIFSRKIPNCVRDGGAKGDRTPDLLNAIQALSQLSYGPVRFA